ncbi:fungal hydrophobin [Obba rivulosa]|uniref:Hydrophobin n=1 Tax=Obba rivulosa TaxID=1052685 RepID=A0A8E2AMK3_9APHY|nr:fungal hydrophobin [Obba rivulosa]
MKFTTTFACIAGLATLAAATPMPWGSQPSSGASCCSSVGQVDSDPIASVLKGLGVVIQDITAIVGVNCSPITVVGVGSGSACSGTTVTCSSNELGGLIQIGCVPVTA